jgi:hypothetical protein
MHLRVTFCVGTILLVLAATACARRVPGSSHHNPTIEIPKPLVEPPVPSIVQARLTSPGSPPFHLKAVISERGDPDSKTELEMFWMAPDKWRRTIAGPIFSQTLDVDGGKVFEQDSDNYSPLYLQTLITAMVDPQLLLATVRPSDRLMTKANGASDESGRMCFDSKRAVCNSGSGGLREIVGAPGHPVEFMDYELFKGKRVARVLVSSPEIGVSYRAQVTELEELENPDATFFSVSQPTPKKKQLHAVILQEKKLRRLPSHSSEMIWPQVLDGATTGPSSYYVSVDPSGRVREAVPLQTANERANDSARRQLMKWKFKPVLKDGVPVEAEAILTFATNTRAWGPANPLTNAEVRKLVSNLEEPVFPPGLAPSGTSYALRAAIDSDGQLIEVIAGSGPPKLFPPCYEAIKKWHFNPIMENGQPRPYRAEIDFVVP